MSVLSKLIAGRFGMQLLTTNCYETAHPWNPSCTGALTDVIWEGWMFSFKTYMTVYLLSSLANTRDPRKIDWRRLIRDTIRSATFLTANLLGYLFWMCRFRQMMGFWCWPTLGLTNGLLSSFFAILIEQKRRRPMLALYLTNLASETAFRQLVNHGYLKMIPNGESLVLSVGLAGFCYLYHKRLLDPSTAKMLKLALKLSPNHAIAVDRLAYPLQKPINWLRSLGKHDKCAHKDSCASSAFEGFIRNFAIGYMISIVINVGRSIRQLVYRPWRIASSLFSPQTFRLPLFLGCLPLLYNMTQCLCSRLFNRTSIAFPVLGGAVSGLSMIFYPSVSIAMYILWKWIETVYFMGVTRGVLPSWKHGDILMYTISTGYVLFMASMEPHSIRTGYWKFLVRLSDNKALSFNRKLFDRFGFGSSRLLGEYRPKLNNLHTTMNHEIFQ